MLCYPRNPQRAHPAYLLCIAMLRNERTQCGLSSRAIGAHVVIWPGIKVVFVLSQVRTNEASKERTNVGTFYAMRWMAAKKSSLAALAAAAAMADLRVLLLLAVRCLLLLLR